MDRFSAVMERSKWRPMRISWVMGATLWLGGCSAYNTSASARKAPMSAIEAVPRPGSAARGHVTVASWYGPGFIGQRTASGEVYHRDDLTAASRSLPLGTRVQVTNLDTGRSVVVRINDRGPYVRGRGIDLSERAAERIGLNHSGIARVSVTRLDKATMASALPSAPASEGWSGRARVSHYAPRPYRSVRHAYRYRSASYRAAPRTVANPIGDWLLQMVR